MTITFGVFAPQGWKTELAPIEGAAAQWAHCRNTALAAEAAGYDHVWVYDHVHPIPDPTSGDPVFECWTTMAALAEATSTIRLGQMVGCTGYREPALLAKTAATVDVISGGRLEWGIGAGWYQHEYAGYGFDTWGTPAERIGRLREGVEIVTSMWANDRTDYEGRWYTTVDARCDPKPLQSPRPPIWIGGSGEQLTLKVVARYADWANFGGKPDEFAHKVAVLRSHCESFGRDPDEVRCSIHQDCIVGATDADVDRKVAERMAKWSITGESEESYRKGHLVGTPQQVAERIATYVELGARSFVMWFPDYPSLETLELFASDVLPLVRELA